MVEEKQQEGIEKMVDDLEKNFNFTYEKLAQGIKDLKFGFIKKDKENIVKKEEVKKDEQNAKD